ncbi:Antiviral helicase ski2 [Malassezia yamatoensis]|uniref:Antiviral helicase ski2 n=1 Tax=Malassezia yamatoensis TaxID=253288 RepID=A0AAJ5YSY3_9BASI|nr:Antiviral helicase ski2 [Malassezia yamatoensis]
MFETPGIDTLLNEIKLKAGGEDAEKLRSKISETLLTPKWEPEHEWIIDDQEHWTTPLDFESTLSLDPSPSTSALSFVRSGLHGSVVGYQEAPTEAALQELSQGATPNMSLQRPMNPSHAFVRGKADEAPFRPGGLDDDAVLDQESDFLSTSENKTLRRIAPGLSRGLDTEVTYHASAPEWKDSIAASETTSRTVITAEADGVYKSSDQAPAAQNDDALVDELLPVESIPRVFHDTQEPKQEETRQWVHVINLHKQMPNFRELVPEMAHEFPFELDTFQKQAVYHLERSDSVFVAAHTSAGKTVVAEYAIALAMKHMTRCIYTSPIKALSNQKFRDFKKAFGAENVGILTGDVQINPEAPCLIMTTEILRSMLYRGADLIRDVEFVIFDEVHYVNDQERGVVWEEVIILLPAHITIILLSATVPNTKEFAGWVGRTKKKDVYVISTLKRPVPLEHFVYSGKKLHKIVDANGRFLSAGAHDALEAAKPKQVRESEEGGQRGKAPIRGRGGGRGGASAVPRRKGVDRSVFVHLVGLLKKQSLLPVVVFVFSKRKCEEYADSLASTSLSTALEKSEVHVVVERSLARLKDADRELPQIQRMREMLSRGIGVHHSGLLPILKELVEILFQRGLVKVLFATETFAMGVNMPARSVVFASTRKNDGTNFRNLLSGEYTQMSGRAGRRGLDATGVVILLHSDELPDANGLNKMILGQSRKLVSQFRITYSMVLNLLRVEALKVEEMIKRSFSENSTQRLLPQTQEKLKNVEEKITSVESDLKACTVPRATLERFYEASRDASQTNLSLLTLAFHHSQGSKCLGPGRVVLLRDGFFDFTPAFIIRPVTGEHFLVLAAVSPAQKTARSIKANVVTPMWVSSNHAAALRTNDLVPVSREVPLSSLAFVTQFSESLPASAIQARRPSAMRQAVTQLRPAMDAIADLLERSGAQAPIDILSLEVDWTRLRQLDFQEAKSARELALKELVPLQDIMKERQFLRDYQLMHKYMQMRLLAARIANSLSDQNLELLPDYYQRVEVLKALRFIDPDSETVLLKGRVACEMRSANELILTELMLDNMFIDYEPAEIAALLTVFHFKEKSGSEDALAPRLQDGFNRIMQVAERVSTVQTAHQISTDEDPSALKTGLVNVVYEWAKGTNFQDIMRLTDVGEGTIVRCITRLDETFRELRDASRVIGDVDLLEKMELCQQLIRRDIVFAASLYF